jgi:hypothetical protein
MVGGKLPAAGDEALFARFMSFLSFDLNVSYS